MPMPNSFTRLIGQHHTGRGRYGRVPIASVLAVGLVVGAILNAFRTTVPMHIAAAVVGTLAVIAVDGMQRRAREGAIALPVVVSLMTLAIVYFVFPMALILGSPFVPAVFAVLVFIGRRDIAGVTAATVMAVCGLLLRLVLSVSPLPYPVFVAGLAAVAMAVLLVVVRPELSRS